MDFQLKKEEWMKNCGVRIPFVIIILALVLCFFHGSGLAQNQPDTVRVECLNFVSPQTTVTADVTLWTDEEVCGFQIPLTFYDPLNTDIICDSVSWSSTFWNNKPFIYGANIDSLEKKVVIFGVYMADHWPLGDNLLATLYFTTGSGWDGSNPLTVDSTSSFWGIPLVIELADCIGFSMPCEFIPGCQLLPPVPTHTSWSLIILILVVAGLLGYIIIRSKQISLVK